MVHYCAFLQHRKMPLNLFLVKCYSNSVLILFGFLFTLFLSKHVNNVSFSAWHFHQTYASYHFFLRTWNKSALKRAISKKHFNENNKLRNLKIYNKIILRNDNIFITFSSTCYKTDCKKNFQMQIDILIETHFEPNDSLLTL